MAFENFPYTNFHEINLDWIVARVKEAYSASNPPDYPVKSVNGMTGDVIIAIPANLVQSVNGETGDVILYRNPLVQFPTTDEQRWNLFRICDGDERGIEFDEDGAHRIEGTRRILIYDEENQPDYPVTSVNGQTGDVRITAGVNSVNGKMGNVVTPFVNPNSDILKLDSNSNTILWGISRDVSGGNAALYISTGAGNPQAFIRYTPTSGEPINLPLLTNADIPESAGVVSINTKTGAVTLYGSDILLSETSETNITSAIQNAEKEIVSIKENIFADFAGNNINWINAFYMPATGEYNPATEYIVTQNYIDTEIYRYIRTSNNIKIALFAWENSEYIGIYNANSSRFIKPNFSENYFYEYLDLNEIALNFPSYEFKIEARLYPTATTIAIQDMENVIFSKYRGGTIDIEELTQTVENHTQQISKLQTDDSTHARQISALQTDDSTHAQQISDLQASQTTHNQQISALQTEDTSQNQQISELQNADATHNQQISALQASQATQDRQISELYTRTGVYVISIPNANSLPLRYPATGTDSKIKDTNKVVSMDLSIPGAQVSNWTITTYDAYLEISGTINGGTDITLYLA